MKFNFARVTNGLTALLLAYSLNETQETWRQLWWSTLTGCLMFSVVVVVMTYTAVSRRRQWQWRASSHHHWPAGADSDAERYAMLASWVVTVSSLRSVRLRTRPVGVPGIANCRISRRPRGHAWLTRDGRWRFDCVNCILNFVYWPWPTRFTPLRLSCITQLRSTPCAFARFNFVFYRRAATKATSCSKKSYAFK